jgi:hypothetical protein
MTSPKETDDKSVQIDHRWTGEDHFTERREAEEAFKAYHDRNASSSGWVPCLRPRGTHA